MLITAMWVAIATLSYSQQPNQNMLVVLADDLGTEQLASYVGSASPNATPTLDSLADRSVVFDHAWANPICSPTRAMIQTGRYAFRTGIGGIVREDTTALDPSEITLPEMLSSGAAGGFATAAIGKWHLGNAGVGGWDAPNLAGYEHFSGSLENLADYYDWHKIVNGTRQTIPRYASTETVDDALNWIQAQSEPWFCYVAFHAPHAPFHQPPESLHTVDFNLDDSDELRYRAMVEALDTELGRLLAGLGSQLADTNVIFLSDNGTPASIRLNSPHPHQSKWYLFEGGVRVPMMISGPAVTAPGRRCSALVSVADIYATLAELAGVDLASQYPQGVPLDSRSLVPLLQDAQASRHRTFNYTELFSPTGFGPYDHQAVSVSDGEFKLILSRGYKRHEPEALFDLRVDPYELNNLLHLPSWPNEVENRRRSLIGHLRRLRKE